MKMDMHDPNEVKARYNHFKNNVDKRLEAFLEKLKDLSNISDGRYYYYSEGDIREMNLQLDMAIEMIRKLQNTFNRNAKSEKDLYEIISRTRKWKLLDY